MVGLGNAQLRDDADLLVRVEDLDVCYPGPGREPVTVVSGLSFDLAEGETLSIVGESGCGKTTTGRALVQLVKPAAGSVTFEGRELVGMSTKEMRSLRPRLQMIFQDPISSLNPRRKVKDLVGEGPSVWGASRQEVDKRVDEALSAVGFTPEAVRDRLPGEFSGGQCQRIAIARAMVLDPRVLICDEPVSALDVSVQAQILNVLADMKERYGLSLIFVSHDLSVVRNVSDRLVVMYLGRGCEMGAATQIYSRPAHPYTQALLEVVPTIGRRRERSVRLTGELPSMLDPPTGCRFHTRCPIAEDRCRTETPMMRPVGPDHFVACHLATPYDVAVNVAAVPPASPQET